MLGALGVVQWGATAAAACGALCGTGSEVDGACGLAPVAVATCSWTVLAALALAFPACVSAFGPGGAGGNVGVAARFGVTATLLFTVGGVALADGTTDARGSVRTILIISVVLATALLSHAAYVAHGACSRAADARAPARTLREYFRLLYAAMVAGDRGVMPGNAVGPMDVEAGGSSGEYQRMRGNAVRGSRRGSAVAPAPASALAAPTAAQRGGVHSRQRLHGHGPPHSQATAVLPVAQPAVPGANGAQFAEGVDDKSDTHKFYCPICMLYYKETLRTACCGNYLCEGCAVSFINGKAMVGRDGQPAALSISCPYCNEKELRLIRVKPSEEARRYEDSPATVRLRNKGVKRISAPSPIRVGDDWAAMDNKMVGFGTAAEAVADELEEGQQWRTPRHSLEESWPGDAAQSVEFQRSVERVRSVIAAGNAVANASRPVATIVTAGVSTVAPGDGDADAMATPARQTGGRPPRPPASRATPAVAPGVQAMATPFSTVAGGVSPGPQHVPWEHQEAQDDREGRRTVARRLDAVAGGDTPAQSPEPERQSPPSSSE